jgi:hypothetical protein
MKTNKKFHNLVLIVLSFIYNNQYVKILIMEKEKILRILIWSLKIKNLAN